MQKTNRKTRLGPGRRTYAVKDMLEDMDIVHISLDLRKQTLESMLQDMVEDMEMFNIVVPMRKKHDLRTLLMWWGTWLRTWTLINIPISLCKRQTVGQVGAGTRDARG